MKTIMDVGGPAFPTECSMPSPLIGDDSLVSGIHPGMTLRDYFAAKAMQAQQTAFWAMDAAHGWSSQEIANESYAMADAMLKARES